MYYRIKSDDKIKEFPSSKNDAMGSRRGSQTVKIGKAKNGT